MGLTSPSGSIDRLFVVCPSSGRINTNCRAGQMLPHAGTLTIGSDYAFDKLVYNFHLVNAFCSPCLITVSPNVAFPCEVCPHLYPQEELALIKYF